MLISQQDTGFWGWTGIRLRPALGLTPTHAYADLSTADRDERVAQDEAAWLAAQWNAAAGTRIEVRYLTRPDLKRIECAVLTGVTAPSAEAIHAAAQRALERLGKTPPHVRTEPLGDAHDVHRWLVPFAPRPGGLVELRKRLTWARCARPESGRAVCVAIGGFGPGRADWETLLRELVALPYPAMLTMGFVPFEGGAPFQAALTRLAHEYALLAQPTSSSPVFSRQLPADQFAAGAASGYAEAATRYTGRCYRVRISVAAQGVVPPYIGELMNTALAPGGGAVALQPADGDVPAALNNLGALNFNWLEQTYAQTTPNWALGQVERVLADLVDADQARAVLRLPAYWPGREELFDPGPRRTRPGTDAWDEPGPPTDPTLRRNPFEDPDSDSTADSDS